MQSWEASREHFPCCVVQSVWKGGSKPFFSAELTLSSMPSINLVFYPLYWFIIVSQIKLNKWFNEFRYYNGWVTVVCFSDYFLSVQFSRENQQPYTYILNCASRILHPESLEDFPSPYTLEASQLQSEQVWQVGAVLYCKNQYILYYLSVTVTAPPLAWKFLAEIWSWDSPKQIWRSRCKT